MEEDYRVDENYRISMDELKEFFNGKREASFEEYYEFLEWRRENKKRGA